MISCKSSIEVLKNGVHETGELPRFHLSSHIDAREALRDVEAVLRPGDGHVELAGVFGNSIFIVAIEITGVAIVNSIEDNYIIELQAFRLVNGGNEDAVVEAGAIAKVGLFKGIEFENMATQLSGQRDFVISIYDVACQIMGDALEALYGSDDGRVEQLVVDMKHLADKCRKLGFPTYGRRPVAFGGCQVLDIEILQGMQIELLIVAPKRLDTILHTFLRHELPLGRYHGKRLLVAIAHDRAGGGDIGIGKVGVLSR